MSSAGLSLFLVAGALDRFHVVALDSTLERQQMLPTAPSGLQEEDVGENEKEQRHAKQVDVIGLKTTKEQS